MLATEWKEFRDVDLGRLKALVRTPVFIDGRNALSPAAWGGGVPHARGGSLRPLTRRRLDFTVGARRRLSPGRAFGSTR